VQQGQLFYNGLQGCSTSIMGCRAAALPKILRRIKLNILIKIIVRKYIHSLREYEIILNANTLDGLLSTAESERAVPYSDVSRPSCGKTATALLQAELQALQPR